MSAKSGVRGLTKGRKKKDAVEKPQKSFYLGRVEQCFNLIGANSNTLSDAMKFALEDDEDVEDDLLAKCKSVASSDVTAVMSDEEEDDEKETELNYGNKAEENTNVNCVTSPSPPPPPPLQGLPKRKSRTSKQKKNLMIAVDNYTKSLSAAAKELKASQNTQSQEPEVCLIDEDDMVTVRVNLRGTLSRYTISQDDPFSVIIAQICENESVEEKCVMLVHKDKTLRSEDTPTSVDLQIADIIECHIMSSLEDSFNDSFDQDNPNVIELVIQSQDSKHRILVKAHTNKPISNIIGEYAKRVKKDPKYLQFIFDGEDLNPKQTPKMFDMEEGDVIDVKELSELLPAEVVLAKKAKLASVRDVIEIS